MQKQKQPVAVRTISPTAAPPELPPGSKGRKKAVMVALFFNDLRFVGGQQTLFPRFDFLCVLYATKKQDEFERASGRKLTTQNKKR